MKQKGSMEYLSSFESGFFSLFILVTIISIKRTLESDKRVETIMESCLENTEKSFKNTLFIETRLEKLEEEIDELKKNHKNSGTK